MMRFHRAKVIGFGVDKANKEVVEGRSSKPGWAGNKPGNGLSSGGLCKA